MIQTSTPQNHTPPYTKLGPHGFAWSGLTVSAWHVHIAIRLLIVYLLFSIGVVDLVQGALARVHLHEVTLELTGRGKPDQTVRADEALRLVRHLGSLLRVRTHTTQL